MLSVGLNEDAAREAYLASFHMAQAYISERTDKTLKTHSGVHREFSDLPRTARGQTPARGALSV
jgi:hypothetical protein